MKLYKFSRILKFQYIILEFQIMTTWIYYLNQLNKLIYLISQFNRYQSYLSVVSIYFHFIK
jgi:hypothetical protein